jgi:predicted metal-dependent hydrolase
LKDNTGMPPAATRDPAVQLSLFEDAPEPGITLPLLNHTGEVDGVVRTQVEGPADAALRATSLEARSPELTCAPAPAAPAAPTAPAAPAAPHASVPAATPAPLPADWASSPPLPRPPLADREIQLGEHVVAYELRRSRRHSIGFVIGPQGLAVSAPRWVGKGEIEAALREKATWILRKLHEQTERQRRLESSKIEWRDGATFPFLGETVIVVLDHRVTGSVLRSAEGTLPGVPRLTLHLGLPQDAAVAQVRDAVQSWLQRQARRIFEERAEVFAARLSVRVKRLTLSSAATRWGSASADGSIRLNWRLVHFALPVIDYVVTHELAHLREMNHSPAFWEVVRTAIPQYEAARGVLRSEQLPAFD